MGVTAPMARGVATEVNRSSRISEALSSETESDESAISNSSYYSSRSRISVPRRRGTVARNLLSGTSRVLNYAVRGTGMAAAQIFNIANEGADMLLDQVADQHRDAIEQAEQHEQIAQLALPNPFRLMPAIRDVIRQPDNHPYMLQDKQNEPLALEDEALALEDGQVAEPRRRLRQKQAVDSIPMPPGSSSDKPVHHFGKKISQVTQVELEELIQAHNQAHPNDIIPPPLIDARADRGRGPRYKAGLMNAIKTKYDIKGKGK